MHARLVLALLALGSIVGCVILVDLVLLLVHGPVRMVENFYEPVPRYGYRMRPHQEFVFASPYHGYHATVQTNSRGLRDEEVAVPKPAREYRVLLLGDSMTAGLEVEKKETFEAVCEQILARHGPIQVINAGVRGYNLDNILGFLEGEGLKYEADVVVYLFVENDVTTETDYRPARSDVSRGFSLRGIMGRLSTYSHLSHRLQVLRQMLLLRYQRDRRQEEPESVRVPSGMYELLRNPAFESLHYVVTAQRIGELARLSSRAGAEFILVGAPHREEIDPETRMLWNTKLKAPGTSFDFDAIRRYTEHVARQYSVERLDPIPAFRANFPRVNNYWFHKDNHLNEEGHQLLGRLLAEKIQQLASFSSWAHVQATSTEVEQRAGRPD